jgi:hypothetical protein
LCDEQSKVFCVNIGFRGGGGVKKGRAPEWRRIFNRFVFTINVYCKYEYILGIRTKYEKQNKV